MNTRLAIFLLLLSFVGLGASAQEIFFERPYDPQNSIIGELSASPVISSPILLAGGMERESPNLPFDATVEGVLAASGTYTSDAMAGGGLALGIVSDFKNAIEPFIGLQGLAGICVSSSVVYNTAEPFLGIRGEAGIRVWINQKFKIELSGGCVDLLGTSEANMATPNPVMFLTNTGLGFDMGVAVAFPTGDVGPSQ